MGDRVRGWTLTWSEEFDGSAGDPADPRTWRMETGGGGWGNGELQCYTHGSENAFLDGATNLAIVVGNPDTSLTLPRAMLIDYIRHYTMPPP